MSIREHLGICEDAASWSAGILATGLAAAIVASAIGWPIAYYQVETTRVTVENGYEREYDVRGNVILKKR